MLLFKGSWKGELEDPTTFCSQAHGRTTPRGSNDNYWRKNRKQAKRLQPVAGKKDRNEVWTLVSEGVLQDE
jgi:hypothetical protein